MVLLVSLVLYLVCIIVGFGGDKLLMFVYVVFIDFVVGIGLVDVDLMVVNEYVVVVCVIVLIL